MKRGTQTAALLLWALLLALGLPGRAHAQGVTTSALAGRVTNEQGQPVAGVQVVATNTRTGAAYRVVTRSDGRYALQGLQPGGPYRVSVSGLGYAAQSRADLTLTLGQTADASFTLATEALALEALSVTADAGGTVISPGRTGASTVISDSSITRLPTLTRDFTDFTRLVPQVSTSGGGSSGGGRNNRFNSIQIDGAVNNDLFGLAASGTPGGQAGTKPITLEAIQEFQVVLAPFDVRQGGFTGIGVNAITKSGTNKLDGTITLFGRNQDFVGDFRPGRNGTLSPSFGEFKQYEGAFSVGGPIVRDKAFLFVAGEMSRRDAPNGVFIGQPGITVNRARADSVVSVLTSQYGYAPGTVDEINLKRESNNLFGRLDFNLGSNNRLTLRHNFVDAWDDNFARTDAAYQTGLAGYRFNSKTNSSVAQLNSTLFSSFFNELRVGFTTVRDNRDVPTSPFPRIEVDLPAGSCAGSNCRIVAGPENFSIANQLDQDVLEITNDLSFSRGIHNVTVGTHNEFFKFSNLFARNLYGLYRFTGIAALKAGTPSRYEYSFFNESTPGAKESAEFPVRSYSVYAQDRVGIASNFNFTVGVRLDWTSFPDNPGLNPRFTQVFDSVYGARGLGDFTRRTDQIPGSSVTFNPRVGFNWDVLGDETTQLRGGVGMFSGRTPYVWISNAYGNTGLDYTRFTCTAAGTVPAFNPNPTTQPRGCRDPVTGNISSPALVPNEINLVDPGFELPRVLKYALGLDRQLPLGLIATLDGLYTKSINDPVYRDLTIGALAPRDSTVSGRPVWQRVTAPGFGNVYDVFNTDDNYSYSLTAQLQRPFEDGWEFMVAYTYGRSYDVNALRSSQASSNFRFNPIDDNPNDPERRPSDYDVPHRIVGSFTRQMNFLRRAPTDFSLIYVGESGRPYSYTYNGDINNDGSDANDLVFVPATSQQARFAAGPTITPGQSWVNLNAFIEGVECLREARGRVLQRNACRQPWSNRVDVRVAQTIPTLRGQGLQLTLDILNFANLLNPEWGRNEFISNQNEQLLQRSGTTDTGGQVLLTAFAPKTTVFQLGDLSSRYQIQLGVKYSF
jgi:outer membrane receptor for ferrienterochelin and colicin